MGAEFVHCDAHTFHAKECIVQNRSVISCSNSTHYLLSKEQNCARVARGDIMESLGDGALYLFLEAFAGLVQYAEAHRVAMGHDMFLDLRGDAEGWVQAGNGPIVGLMEPAHAGGIGSSVKCVQTQNSLVHWVLHARDEDRNSFYFKGKQLRCH